MNVGFFFFFKGSFDLHIVQQKYFGHITRSEIGQGHLRPSSANFQNVPPYCQNSKYVETEKIGQCHES